MKSWEVYTGRRGFQNKILFVSFWPPVWKTTYLKRISRHVIIFLFPFGLFNTLLLNFTVHHGPQILQTSASSSRLTFSSKARALPAPSSEPSTPASIGSQEGKLGNGQEIAVKRLSKTSGQGMKEFMNEG
ncbi:uncharacterized protein [Populus alba]|uniref:uncharacterized protein n=1 Tax=Populus alba TaxID=43335 RepID=UPI003CC704C2